MSCGDTYRAFGANAASTRLTQQKDCVQAAFLELNPQPQAPCPPKLDPVPKVATTTKLESTRLLEKVVACPLYYRNEIGGGCGFDSSNVFSSPGSSPVYGDLVSPRSYASITGIEQITRPAQGTSSGELIARTRTNIVTSANIMASADIVTSTTLTPSANNASPFIPTFFRKNGPGTSASGAPLPVCRTPKTAQDSGVPFAPLVQCNGPRVVG